MAGLEERPVTIRRLQQSTEVWVKRAGMKVVLDEGALIVFVGTTIYNRGNEILVDYHMIRERCVPI